jgi:hypothetical protein
VLLAPRIARPLDRRAAVDFHAIKYALEEVSSGRPGTSLGMGMTLPPTHVNIADIRRKYHAAEREEKTGAKRPTKDAVKAE